MHAVSGIVHDATHLVVIDTNIWISAFINPRGAPARLLREALAGTSVRLALSAPLINEVRTVLRRDRIRRRTRLSDEGLDQVISEILRGAVLVSTRGDVRLCRDPKDDAILETAIVGQAGMSCRETKT